MRAHEFINEREEPISIGPKGKQMVEYDGLVLQIKDDGVTVTVHAYPSIDDAQNYKNTMAYVVFDRDHNTLIADDLAVYDPYKGQGVAKKMYDYIKSLGFRILASDDQTAAGKHFWEKNKGNDGIWESEEEIINELTFFGSQCTKDCSGHRSGYLWSRRKNAQQVPQSHSPSFNKGAAIGIQHMRQGRNPIGASGIRGQRGRYRKFIPGKTDE
jgi:GNAT superfamily N-acetyltransferase